jgi:hypothetical protein
MEQFNNIYQEADQKATHYSHTMNGENHNVFPCGFGWINIKPANSKFAKWLLEKGLASKDSYLGGVTIWVGKFNQSYEHKSSYAYMFANVLKENGINATSGSRMD